MGYVKPARLVLEPRSVVLGAGLVAASLVVLSVGFTFLDRYSGFVIFDWLSDQFKLNREENVSAFFAGLLIIIDAGLLALVWWSKRGEARAIAWLLLVPLFLFLAFDELFGLHEHLIVPLRDLLDTSGLLYFSWTIVYVIAVLVVAVAFFPVWFALEPIPRFWFAAAAVVYLAGAVGFEAVSGARLEAVGRDGDLVYGALYTVEETLEMAGLIIFAYALLLLLATRQIRLSVAEPSGSPRKTSAPSQGPKPA